MTWFFPSIIHSVRDVEKLLVHNPCSSVDIQALYSVRCMDGWSSYCRGARGSAGCSKARAPGFLSGGQGA